MVGTTSKRSRAASIQKQAIDQVNASLQELPEKPKDNLSLREAVSQLQEEIRAALAKGYSYEDLAAMFSEKGIDISALTLKRYVSSGRSRSKAKSSTPRTRRSRKVQEDTSSAAAPEPVASTATKSGRRGSTAAKAQSTKATTTAEPKKTPGRSSSRASKAGSSASAAKTSSTRSRKRTTK